MNAEIERTLVPVVPNLFLAMLSFLPSLVDENVNFLNKERDIHGRKKIRKLNFFSLEKCKKFTVNISFSNEPLSP